MREDLNQNERLGDILDQVDLQQQKLMDAQIGEIRRQAEREREKMFNPTQECWTCGDVTPSTQHRWCDADCRNLWCEENE